MGDLFRRLDRAMVPALAWVLRGLVGGRARRAVMTALGMSGAVTALLAAVMSARAPGPGQAIVAGVPIRVGVVEGESVGAYVAAAHARLTELGPQAADPTFALVSLAAYVAPDRLGTLLAHTPPARVYLRVPLPGMATEVIPMDVRSLPADVLDGMEAVAARKDEEMLVAQELAAQLVGDGDQERELRAEYEARATQAAAEAMAFREHCSCVYAAVVRAAPPTLTALARRPGVRVVDPTPGLASLEQAVFIPPMPELPAVETNPPEPQSMPSDEQLTPSDEASPTPAPSSTPDRRSAPPEAPPTAPMPPWTPPPRPSPTEDFAPSPSPER